MLYIYNLFCKCCNTFIPIFKSKVVILSFSLVLFFLILKAHRICLSICETLYSIVQLKVPFYDSGNRNNVQGNLKAVVSFLVIYTEAKSLTDHDSIYVTSELPSFDSLCLCQQSLSGV